MRWLNSFVRGFRKNKLRGNKCLRRHLPRLNVEQLEARTLLDAAANSFFVGQAFRDLFHREVDPGSQAALSHVLDLGITRSQLVMALENTPEFPMGQGQTVYNALLHRPVDPSPLTV